MKTWCTLRTLLLIAATVTLLAAAGLLAVSGYRWQAALMGVSTLAGVAAAALADRNRPEPPSAREQLGWQVLDEPLPDEPSETERRMLADPVDAHAAQWIRALSGQSAVLPESRLLQPPRPGACHRRDC